MFGSSCTNLIIRISVAIKILSNIFVLNYYDIAVPKSKMFCFVGLSSLWNLARDISAFRVDCITLFAYLVEQAQPRKEFEIELERVSLEIKSLYLVDRNRTFTSNDVQDTKFSHNQVRTPNYKELPSTDARSVDIFETTNKY